MKKLLLLLLFIPIVSFGQSYKDVMSISSVDMFKKVVIENGYEFSSNTDETITYGFNIIKDSINADKSTRWAQYNPENDKWSFIFSRTDALASLAGAFLGVESETDNSKNPYNLITEGIKEKCKYYKIQNVEGTDFVTYSCSESSYKGKIGFAIADGSGIVLHFSNE